MDLRHGGAGLSRQHTDRPVVILCAGPAGMAAAEALGGFGFAVRVLEASAHAGGIQRNNFHPNLWLLGSPEESGRAMTERLRRHFESLPARLHCQATVNRIEPAGDGFQLALAGPEVPPALEAAAIVLATGTRPRASGILHELAASSGRVLIGPLDEAARDRIVASRVLILGGGDNALDHALLLAERGSRVVVCTRAGLSARPAFRSACAANGRIELRTHCQPLLLTPIDAGLTVHWSDHPAETFDWLLVLYGYQPNSEVVEVFAPAIRPALKSSGHVEVDAWQRSTVPRVYAAGDLTDSPQPSVAAAIAQGLAAARAIESDLAEVQPPV